MFQKSDKKRTLSVLSHRLLKDSDEKDKDYDSRSERSFSSRSDSLGRHSPRRNRSKSEDRDFERGDRSPRLAGGKYDDDFSPPRRGDKDVDEKSAPRKFKLDIGSPRNKEDIYSSLESISDGPISPPRSSSFSKSKYDGFEFDAKKASKNEQKGSFIFTKQEKEQPKVQSKFDKYGDGEFNDEFDSGRGGGRDTNVEWNSKKKYDKFADKHDFDSAPSSDRFYKKDPFKSSGNIDDNFNKKSKFNERDDFREEKNNSRLDSFKPKKSLVFVEEEDEIEDQFVPKPSRYQTGKFDYSPKFKSREL